LFVTNTEDTFVTDVLFGLMWIVYLCSTILLPITGYLNMLWAYSSSRQNQFIWMSMLRQMPTFQILDVQYVTRWTNSNHCSD